MKKVDFDDYAQPYDSILEKQLGFFERGTGYFAEYKIRAIKRILKKDPERILEYGCGTGRNLTHLVTLFPGAKVWGCDISEKSLEAAAAKNATVKTFLLGEETFPGNLQFDLIVAANVFHHITPVQRAQHLRRLYTWLEPGGTIFLFEQNPFNPVTRHLVRTCPFDQDAVLLRPSEALALIRDAGFTALRKRYMLFFPSFLRRLRVFEQYMENMPFGGQYSIEGLKP